MQWSFAAGGRGATSQLRGREDSDRYMHRVTVRSASDDGRRQSGHRWCERAVAPSRHSLPRARNSQSPARAPLGARCADDVPLVGDLLRLVRWHAAGWRRQGRRWGCRRPRKRDTPCDDRGCTRLRTGSSFDRVQCGVPLRLFSRDRSRSPIPSARKCVRNGPSQQLQRRIEIFRGFRNRRRVCP